MHHQEELHLNNTTFIDKTSEKKALLIETDPMLLTFHYTLLSQHGFSVDVARTIPEVLSKENIHYHAIFSRLNQQGLNGWMATRIFEFLPKEHRPKVYLFVEKGAQESIKTHFINRGVQGVFELPLTSQHIQNHMF